MHTEEFETATPASERPQTHGHEERRCATNYYTNEDVAVEKLQFVFRIQDDAGSNVSLKTYCCMVFVGFLKARATKPRTTA
jgi:hypothetical protein